MLPLMVNQFTRLIDAPRLWITDVLTHFTGGWGRVRQLAAWPIASCLLQAKVFWIRGGEMVSCLEDE